MPGQVKILITKSYAALPVTQARTEARAVQQPAHLIFSTALRGKDCYYLLYTGGTKRFNSLHKVTRPAPGRAQQRGCSSALCSSFSGSVIVFYTDTNCPLFWLCRFLLFLALLYIFINRLQVAMHFNVMLICSSVLSLSTRAQQSPLLTSLGLAYPSLFVCFCSDSCLPIIDTEENLYMCQRQSFTCGINQGYFFLVCFSYLMLFIVSSDRCFQIFTKPNY